MSQRQPLGVPDTEELRAFDLFRESGVYSPQYAGEIAELRRICNEWQAVGRPLI